MGVINSNDIPFIVVIIASLIAMIFQLAFIFTKQTRKAKKPVRFVTTLSLLYIITFYTIIVLSDTPFLGHGFAAAVGFIFVIIPLIADTIVDWRRMK